MNKLKIKYKNTKLLRTCLITILLSCQWYDSSAFKTDDITFDDRSYKGGLIASPNGFGFFFRQSTPIQNGLFRVFDVSFTSINSIREKKVLNQRMLNTTPYVYGKVNRLYALRPMIGLQKTFAERNTKNSIGVNGFACIGLGLGFLKPIYMDVLVFDPSSADSIRTASLPYNPVEMDPQIINGYSSFDKGLGKTKLIAGLSCKAGVEFNWGNYTSIFRSIELGFMVDYFPSRPELLYGIKNKVLYSSFYISFALGELY
ncbi:MAG: hypothetical protein IT245_07555 [Bacteroidia bacterium]|nr:hypothetical protein [Bacteroidia bacterium]